MEARSTPEKVKNPDGKRRMGESTEPKADEPDAAASKPKPERADAMLKLVFDLALDRAEKVVLSQGDIAEAFALAAAACDANPINKGIGAKTPQGPYYVYGMQADLRKVAIYHPKNVQPNLCTT